MVWVAMKAPEARAPIVVRSKLTRVALVGDQKSALVNQQGTDEVGLADELD
jgi:hypothetical protein